MWQFLRQVIRRPCISTDVQFHALEVCQHTQVYTLHVYRQIQKLVFALLFEQIHLDSVSALMSLYSVFHMCIYFFLFALI